MALPGTHAAPATNALASIVTVRKYRRDSVPDGYVEWTGERSVTTIGPQEPIPDGSNLFTIELPVDALAGEPQHPKVNAYMHKVTDHSFVVDIATDLQIATLEQASVATTNAAMSSREEGLHSHVGFKVTVLRGSLLRIRLFPKDAERSGVRVIGAVYRPIPVHLPQAGVTLLAPHGPYQLHDPYQPHHDGTRLARILGPPQDLGHQQVAPLHNPSHLHPGNWQPTGPPNPFDPPR